MKVYVLQVFQEGTPGTPTVTADPAVAKRWFNDQVNEMYAAFPLIHVQRGGDSERSPCAYSDDGSYWASVYWCQVGCHHNTRDGRTCEYCGEVLIEPAPEDEGDSARSAISEGAILKAGEEAGGVFARQVQGWKQQQEVRDSGARTFAVEATIVTQALAADTAEILASSFLHNAIITPPLDPHVIDFAVMGGQAHEIEPGRR